MLTSILDASLSSKAKRNQKHQTLWNELPRGALPLAIAQAAKKHSGLTLVITDNIASTEEIKRALAFYLSGSEIDQFDFPEWESLPYERISAHPVIASTRIQTLYWLTQGLPGILVTPITALLQKLPPKAWLSSQGFVLATGDKLDSEAESKRLEASGYVRVDHVYEKGEYAVRGSLLDVFQVNYDLPIRIDLLHDQVASLRTFDPESQRTVEVVDQIGCLVARETPITKGNIEQFNQQWLEKFGPDSIQSSIYQDVNKECIPAGIEYYLPLFFEETSTLFDYLPKDTHLVTTDSLSGAVTDFMGEVRDRYKEKITNQSYPLLPPNDLFIKTDYLFQKISDFSRTNIVQGIDKKSPYKLEFQAKPVSYLLPEDSHNNINSISDLLEAHTVERILFCVHSLSRLDILSEKLKEKNIPTKQFDCFSHFISSENKLGIIVSDISSGLFIEDIKTLLVTEEELFHKKNIKRKYNLKSSFNYDQVIQDLVELKPGDLVVHVEHGIGIYKGLEAVVSEGQEIELLVLSYAGDASLYVPVSYLHMISRYTGANPELVTLNQLGTQKWKKERNKAKEKIYDMAAELLKAQAIRHSRQGFLYQIPKPEYQEFCDQFSFEETPDQASAIEKIQSDMASKSPMDRLVCGDVGFGKTEVAMRAAFIAVMNGKQVVMITPTTLISRQHTETFQNRFAQWPVQVHSISRVLSEKKLDLVREDIASGKADIVIGTHKLLYSKIRFHNLGLVIIDEEHKFGVRQKEQLKAFRAETDVLTLSATPIPRTLDMAISGLRDLSIIATPPADRMSIKTIIHENDQGLIKEAIQRELRRGGQVFYVHNKINTIERIVLELDQLIPTATVMFAHGQMGKPQMEQIMSDFYQKRIDILVCSTIIESGIDVPNANTIIINRADQFGLAQLHQLRGRVGRSYHQAYAYLLTPHPEDLTKEAKKRLKAIQEASELGIGFSLATHDLEIRGAGNLLGEDQSGEIASVGFSLYMQMLQKAIRATASGEKISSVADLSDDEEIEVDMQLSALIPERYLSDVNHRLSLYKRIASASDEGVVKELRSEIIDRFGMPPKQLDNLFQTTEVKLLAKPLGIKRILAGARGGELEFHQSTQVAPHTLIAMVEQNSDTYSLKQGDKFCFHADLIDPEKRFGYLKDLLQKINSSLAAA